MSKMQDDILVLELDLELLYSQDSLSKYVTSQGILE